MSDPIRYAIYYTPAPGSALAAFGAAVLGGEPFLRGEGGDGLDPALSASLAAVTAEPRTYGFHATLKAPMRLASGVAEGDLLDAAAALAEYREPIRVGRLGVVLIGDFAALVPEAPPPELGLFAAECVAALDPLRAALSEPERARRRPERLGPRRRALLDRWGYPHVFEAFRFHMTLTGRLPAGEGETWRAGLACAYGRGEDLVVDAVTVLRQDGTEPFRVLRRISFGEGEAKGESWHGG